MDKCHLCSQSSVFAIVERKICFDFFNHDTGRFGSSRGNKKIGVCLDHARIILKNQRDRFGACVTGNLYEMFGKPSDHDLSCTLEEAIEMVEAKQRGKAVSYRPW